MITHLRRWLPILAGLTILLSSCVLVLQGVEDNEPHFTPIPAVRFLD